MNIDSKELKEFVENNPSLVTRKQAKRYPNLYVLKYTKRVFYDALWHLNPLLNECRGLVVDADYNVVIKPFTKIFNYQENGTTIDPEEACLVVRKINGFMACATYNPDVSKELIISTTGSLDSDFVTLASKYLSGYLSAIKTVYDGIVKLGKNHSLTIIFEICDPSDPHIIEEEAGAYLIGANYNGYQYPEWDLDLFAPQLAGCHRPFSNEMKFSEVLEEAKHCDHEGFMVYGQESGTGLKLKSPFYKITKFLARASGKKLEQVFKDAGSFRRSFDEEYYPLGVYIADNKEKFMAMEEQDKIQFIRVYLQGY